MLKKLMQKFEKLSQLQKIAVVAVVAFAGWWVYKNYLSPDAMRVTERYSPSNNDTQSPGTNLVCTMYYTEWCPHCKTVKPQWQALKDRLHGKKVGGRNIIVTSVDCEKEKDKASAAGVSGFPTFKFDIDGKSLTYSSPERTTDGFLSYIKSIAGSD
jgi:thiol-disulfide isomerase/thioredoxin